MREECSKNVIYTGATINQQASPAVDYLMSPEGGGKKRFYLVGTDYVYPRTTNKILRIYLTKAKGVQESGIMEEYTPSTTRTIRPSWGRSRASALGAMGPSSIPSTVIATCPSSKS